MPIFRPRHNQQKKSNTRPRARFGIALVGAALIALAGCGGSGSGSSSGSGNGADAGASGNKNLDLIQPGTLTSASSGEYRPFSYFDDGGKLVGFDKDISDAVAKQMGLKSDTKTGEFATLIGGIQSNRYDVIIGSMTPTPKREKAVSFSNGYYTSGAQLFVQKSSSCTDPKSLKAATIGVASGTTYEDFLKDKKWVASTKTYASDVVALKDLSTGRLDGVGRPAAMHDRRADADGEGLGFFRIGHQCRELLVHVWPFPVQDRALGQIRQIAFQLGQLAVQDKSDTDEGAVVEPAQRLSPPLLLDRGPRRDL